eukprot:m.171993 g.171993  ORF g.171993 m.171993 type:complete len:1286 (-) comp21275_c0_seq3:202-4059(-)
MTVVWSSSSSSSSSSFSSSSTSMESASSSVSFSSSLSLSLGSAVGAAAAAAAAGGTSSGLSMTGGSLGGRVSPNGGGGRDGEWERERGSSGSSPVGSRTTAALTKFRAQVSSLSMDTYDELRRLSSISAEGSLDLPVLQWGSYEVAEWLKQQDQEKHKRVFLRRKVDGPQLLLLERADLDKMGIRGAEQQSLFNVIQELQTDNPRPPKAIHWSSTDVGDWLEHQELSPLKKAFAKKRIDGKKLLKLRPPLLEKMQIHDLDRQTKVLRAVDRLKKEAEEGAHSPARLLQWSAPEVGDWLEYEGLSQLKPYLLKRRVDGNKLVQLTHHDLFSMGIKGTEAQCELIEHITQLRAAAREHNPHNPLLWSSAEVGEWLEDLELQQYKPTFRKREIDGPRLLQLDEDSLVTLGFEPESMHQILESLKRLKSLDSHVLKQRPSTEWEVSDVACWLQSKGLTRLVPLFVRAEVDGTALRSLRAFDLVKLGVEDQDEQTKLLDAVDNQKAEDYEKMVKAASVDKWTTDEVVDWLVVQCELDSVAHAFRDHRVTGAELLSLQSPQRLLDKGVTQMQDQMTVMQSVDRLRHEQQKALDYLRRHEVEQESHLTAPWYHPSLTKEEMTDMLAGMPDGAFVVSRPHGRSFHLAYVYHGQVQFTRAEVRAAGICLPLARRMYPNLASLVSACSCSPAKELPCVLDPFALTRARPAASSRESWNKLGLPRDEALAGLQQASAGSFVVLGMASSQATLCYVHNGELRFESIGTEQGSLSGPGVFLVNQPDFVFDDLSALVEFIQEGHPLLPMPLHPYVRRQTEELNWWQMSNSAEGAEALLEGGETGDFVIYPSRNKFVLAYKNADVIEREEIRARSGVQQGVYFSRAPQQIYSSTQQLVSQHSKERTLLSCVLQVHTAPDDDALLPDVSGSPSRSSSLQTGLERAGTTISGSVAASAGPTAVQQAPAPMAWLHIAGSADAVAESLQLERPGSFAVLRRPDRFQLLYKAGNEVVSERVETLLEPSFKGFSIPREKSKVFPTLLDLLIYYCKEPELSVLLLRDQLRFLEQTPGVSWNWCQLGVPIKTALDVIRAGADGWFVLRDHDTLSDRVVLSYIFNHDIITEAVITRGNKVALETAPHVQYDNIISLLTAQARPNHQLKTALVLPALSAIRAKFSSRKARLTLPVVSGRNATWNWWQIDSPPDQALALLDKKPSGSFVVYRGRERSRFVLAYRYHQRTEEAIIAHTPPGALFTPGFCFVDQNHLVFPTLQELVAHFEKKQMKPLKCALRSTEQPPSGAQP